MKKSLLSMLFLFSSIAFSAPSFDCAKAQSKSEIAICTSDLLSELDAELAKAYKLAQLTSADASAIKATQKIWLKGVRDFCEDSACLQLVMEERIEQLQPQEIAPPTVQFKPNFVLTPSPVKDDLLPVTRNSSPSPAPNVVEKKQAAPEVVAKRWISFFSNDTTIFIVVLSVLLGLFVAAIGTKKQATYFANWFDFIASTVCTFLILQQIHDVFVWLAVVVLCHFIMGLMINNFNFKRGLISCLGRSAGIFVFLGIVAASILWVFSKTKGSSVEGRINNGEDSAQAIKNDKDAQTRANLGLAVGVGATGTALYWIDSHFIDNMNKE